MKKNKTVKLFAILGLLWIGISVVWTWIIILTQPKQLEPYKINNTFNQEELQKIIDKDNIEIKVGTWETK